MACLCRIRQTRNCLFSQLKKSYFQASAPCLSDYVSRNKLPSSSNHQLILGLLGRSNGVFDNVRCFAAPVQSKKKDEVKASKSPRMNEQIKSHMVRLVSDEGHEIVPFHIALERAKSLNHDLVEVDCNAKPIVCKIMDYHRERYQQQLREKERSKSKADSSVRKGPCKEVRFSPKTEQKDLQIKANAAKRLMERGYRVKCMVIRTDEKQDISGLIDRLYALIEDVAFVESGPRVEKSQAYVVVRHIKFGPPKKAGKVKSADAASSERQKDTKDSGSDSEYDKSFSGDSDSQSTPVQHKSTWSLSDANGAAEKVFDLSNDLENAENRISDQKTKVAPSSFPPKMPRLQPNVTGSGANSSENRYSRQDSTGAQMPQMPNFTGPGSNSSENRYSRREMPKQNPASSNSVPSSTSYGIFSTPSASLPGNRSFESQVRPGNNGGANSGSPPTDSSTETTQRWGLFRGEGPNAAKSSRGFQNQPKVQR